MDDRPHVQIVMGVKNALPAEEHLLDLMLGELRRVMPHATWTAAGIGRNQARVMEWVLARGGDGVRTGLEDNIRRRGGAARRTARNAGRGAQTARTCRTRLKTADKNITGGNKNGDPNGS